MSAETRKLLRTWLPTALWMGGLVLLVVAVAMFSVLLALIIAAVAMIVGGAWLDLSDFE